MTVQQGENPQYDEAIERQLQFARLRYASIEANVAHDAVVAEARRKLADANEAETQAKQALTNCKEAVKLAKANLLRVDVDLRAHRRAESARLQQEAEKLGAKTYATNTPCRNGHHSPRYTSSGACVLCDRIGWNGGRLRTAEHHV